VNDQHPFERLTPRQQATVLRYNGVPMAPDDMERAVRADLNGRNGDVAVFPLNTKATETVLRIGETWLYLTDVGGPIAPLYQIDIPADVVAFVDMLNEADAMWRDHLSDQEQRDAGARGML
jgi:hypothetical protein